MKAASSDIGRSGAPRLSTARGASQRNAASCVHAVQGAVPKPVTVCAVPIEPAKAFLINRRVARGGRQTEGLRRGKRRGRVLVLEVTGPRGLHVLQGIIGILGTQAQTMGPRGTPQREQPTRKPRERT